MAKKTVFPLLLIPAVLMTLSCRTQEPWHSSILMYFDTACEINLFCSASEFGAAQKEVKRIFSEIESAFSPGRSNIFSPLFPQLFEIAGQVYRDSEGSFDITVAPLSRLWGFHDEKQRVPEHREITRALELVGMDKVKEDGGRIALRPQMELDWGGLAKGFGVDLASKKLKEIGISKGFINAGGDLFCWGMNPDGVPWKIGIKHPRHPGFLGVLSIDGLGAATSGDYQRYFEENGLRYHHIFDPHTGYPSLGKQSVTVVGPNTTLCDALSTAIFVSPNPDLILKKYPDYGAIIVSQDGRIYGLGREYALSLIEQKVPFY